MEAMAQTKVSVNIYISLSNPAAIEYSEICTEDIQASGILKTVAGKSDYSDLAVTTDIIVGFRRDK